MFWSHYQYNPSPLYISAKDVVTIFKTNCTSTHSSCKKVENMKWFEIDIQIFDLFVRYTLEWFYLAYSSIRGFIDSTTRCWSDHLLNHEWLTIGGSWCYYDVINVFVTLSNNLELLQRHQTCMRSLYNLPLRPLFQPRHFPPVSIIAVSPPLVSRNYTSFNPFNSIMGGASSSSSANEKYPVEKSDQEWRAVLSPEQVFNPRPFLRLI